MHLFCRHVSAGVVPFVLAAVSRSGSGWSEDSGELLEAPAGPTGEPDSCGPHRPARLGGGRKAGGSDEPTGDERVPDPRARGVWGDSTVAWWQVGDEFCFL